MLLIFAYISCLFLVAGLVTLYHKNNNNLYQIKSSFIDLNLSIYKYGMVYTFTNMNENKTNEIIEYIIEKYDIPYNLYIMKQSSDMKNFTDNGWGLYYNNTLALNTKDIMESKTLHNTIIFYKLDELRDLINQTNETVNTWEWINDNITCNNITCNNITCNKIIIHESIRDLNHTHNNISKLLDGFLFYNFSNNILENDYNNIPLEIIDLLEDNNSSIEEHNSSSSEENE